MGPEDDKQNTCYIFCYGKLLFDIVCVNLLKYCFLTLNVLARVLDGAWTTCQEQHAVLDDYEQAAVPRFIFLEPLVKTHCVLVIIQLLL